MVIGVFKYIMAARDNWDSICMLFTPKARSISDQYVNECIYIQLCAGAWPVGGASQPQGGAGHGQGQEGNARGGGEGRPTQQKELYYITRYWWNKSLLIVKQVFHQMGFQGPFEGDFVFLVFNFSG
jgi:hypothetical protein